MSNSNRLEIDVYNALSKEQIFQSNNLSNVQTKKHVAVTYFERKHERRYFA